ncbi:hypothetical protein IEO21_04942 [Rhodonia placenta]|uniref:DUF6533 domain-containing protein n=1 Tax=Rhodonia placenta TaxID=104341 RepID=A0A8H7U2S4_9APHY|nr:hypothetical protein IEO21_04942 [Postia placenta]
MSGQNTTYIDDTFALELQEGINLSYYYLTSMTALPLYDCLITFGQEINVFWTRNPRPKSMYLFYLNRFALIFLAATNLANQWLFTSTISTFIQTIAEILQYVVLAAEVLSWFVGVNHVLKLTGIQTIVILITGRLCVITSEILYWSKHIEGFIRKKSSSSSSPNPAAVNAGRTYVEATLIVNSLIPGLIPAIFSSANLAPIEVEHRRRSGADHRSIPFTQVNATTDNPKWCTTENAYTTFARKLYDICAIISYVDMAFMIAGVALPVYDLILTLAQEVQVFWSGSSRLKPMLLFYLNRLGIIFLIAVYIQGEFNNTQSRCTFTFVGRGVSGMILYATLAVEIAGIFARSPSSWLSFHGFKMRYDFAFILNIGGFDHCGLNLGCVRQIQDLSDCIPPVQYQTVYNGPTMDTIGRPHPTHRHFVREEKRRIIAPESRVKTRSLTLLNVLEIILYYSDVSSQCFISVYHDSISLVASMGWALGVLHTPYIERISSILVSRFLLDLGASVKREDQHGIDGSELHTFSQATEVDTVQSMKFFVPSDSMLDAYDTGCIRPSSEADVLTSPQVRNIDTLVATEA